MPTATAKKVEKKPIIAMVKPTTPARVRPMKKATLTASDGTTLTISIERITPDMAAEYLTFNTRNRKKRRTWVETLATILENGKFRLTDQAISFNCDNTLINGQHRLEAIVKSGVPAELLVVRGLPREALYAIDQGKNRNIIDITGPVGLEIGLTTSELAIVRAMIRGIRPGANFNRHRTNEAIIEYSVRHIEAVRFAGSLPLGDCSHSTIRGVIARAYYTADRDRLAKFATVVANGYGEGIDDSAALIFKAHYIRFQGQWGGSTRMNSLYAKTEWCLKNFLDRQVKERVFETEVELFPTPEEIEAAKAKALAENRKVLSKTTRITANSIV